MKKHRDRSGEKVQNPSNTLRNLDEWLFSRCVQDENGCLVWTGGTNKGQGIAFCNGKQIRVHRAVWTAANGEPEGDIIRRCRNMLCVNLDHMFDKGPVLLEDDGLDIPRQSFVRLSAAVVNAIHYADLARTPVPVLAARYGCPKAQVYAIRANVPARQLVSA